MQDKTVNRTMNKTTTFQIPSGNTDLATSKMATEGAS